jgi:hypothetical protein
MSLQNFSYLVSIEKIKNFSGKLSSEFQKILNLYVSTSKAYFQFGSLAYIQMDFRLIEKINRKLRVHTKIGSTFFLVFYMLLGS